VTDKQQTFIACLIKTMMTASYNKSLCATQLSCGVLAESLD